MNCLGKTIYNEKCKDEYIKELSGLDKPNLFKMTKTELLIAKIIGMKVGLGKIQIECPVCEKDPVRKGQLLSSFGDHEEILFCPGCNLWIFLKVMTR